MDDFDAITADLRAENCLEQEEQAREILAAADAERGYAEMLRRIPVGEVVTLTTIDGYTARGRVVRVGCDWLRFAEVADGAGTARLTARRIHEVRLDAIARISRESTR
ncbi:MAG: hypothetical protein ACXVJ7_07545 [Acidimicrobiia bacterium]